MLSRTVGLKRSTELRARSPWVRAPREQKPRKVSARTTSAGMKGRAPTAEQKRFHDALASIGCIASLKDGIADPIVSIHHIDGRMKPDAHWLVLPLSAGNHQDGTGAPGRVAVHPYKARFEARYGTQRELLRECIQILLCRGVEVPDGALLAAGMKKPDDCANSPGPVQPAVEVE